MVNNKISFNLLKAGTYALIGTIGTYVVTAIQGGANIPNALITGVSFGLIAGLKNFVKYQFGLDLDLTKLKK